ncbi:AMP-binding protein [Planctomycetota bacterium]|nr:AMP-binding protein [Planctomycetota bacterium]
MPGTEIQWRHGEALPTDRPHTLSDWLDALCREHRHRPVLVCDGRAWTWDALRQAAASLSGQLANDLGIGDRLAIVSPNGAEHLICELAAWRLGAIAAPIFTGFPPARLEAMLALIAPRVAMIADPDHRHLVPAGTKVIPPELALASGPPGPERPVTTDTPCLIQCTSGSTGEPRGVVLTHGNLASQQAAFAMLWPEVGPGDRCAAYLPWHHSFGGLAERLWILGRGATLTVVPGGGRDRDRFLATLRAVRPTVYLSVPKLHRTAIEADALDRSCLRWVFTAGATLGDDLADWYERRGISVAEGWGLTETSPSATITRPGSARRTGVVGQPIPGVSVGVADDGRIHVRGPNVMLGYFRRDDPLPRDADGNRTIDSGDLGAWTDNGLRLIGRSDQVLKMANGEKVHAGCIEARLAAQPGIAHAVVCRHGDDLAAILLPQPQATAADLDHAIGSANAQAEAPYERIVSVWRWDQCPDLTNGLLTASHKLARSRLIERFNAGAADFQRIG